MRHPSLTHRLHHLIKRELRARALAERAYDWSRQGRITQRLPEGDWKIWLILAGRGFGKTRAGSEAIRQWVCAGRCRRLALIGQTERDIEQVMIQGESGLLAIHPESERPQYHVSKKCLIWPNGAVATLYSAERYEKLRGPQFDGAWVDELAKFRHPSQVWEQLMFSLRLGPNPQVIVTTTPRPLPLLKKMLAGKEGKLHLTRGSTFENQKNLSPTFLEHMKNRYAQSPLGRQELEGALLEEEKGALWKWAHLEMCRVQEVPSLERLLIAIDPAVTAHEKSDETGLIVAGRAGEKAYVLEDLSGQYSPQEWARVALEAYERYQADKIIAEVNQGGDLVEQMLRAHSQRISFKAVRANRGKRVRAEPVAHLYEQGLVHHAPGLSRLGEQLCLYTPLSSKSPDRMDALVWAISELMLHPVAQKRAWLTQ